MGCTRHIQKNLFLIAVVLPWHVLKIQLNFDDMKSLHLSLSGALKKGWELTKKHFIVMLGLVLGIWFYCGSSACSAELIQLRFAIGFCI